MRFATIFHFLDFKQDFTYKIKIFISGLYIVISDKFTILSFGKDLNIVPIKKYW